MTGFRSVGHTSPLTVFNACLDENGGCGDATAGNVCVYSTVTSTASCACNTTLYTPIPSLSTPSGWTCAALDPCNTLQPCSMLPNATCTNEVGAGNYTCICGTGYVYAHDGCDPCPINNGGCGSPNAGNVCTFSPTTGAASCTCNATSYIAVEALTTSGMTCVPLDPCSTLHPCPSIPRIRCTNGLQPGTYTCGCENGYLLVDVIHFGPVCENDPCLNTQCPADTNCVTGINSGVVTTSCVCSNNSLIYINGSCVLKDPCRVNNGGCNVTAHMQCNLIAPGASNCTCQAEYVQVDGKSTCVSLNPCVLSPDMLCGPNAYCVANVTVSLFEFDCYCLAGFIVNSTSTSIECIAASTSATHSTFTTLHPASSSSSSSGIIVGAIVGAILAILAICAVLFVLCRKRRSKTGTPSEHEGADMSAFSIILVFTLLPLHVDTVLETNVNDLMISMFAALEMPCELFHATNEIGRGEFGVVSEAVVFSSEGTSHMI